MSKNTGTQRERLDTLMVSLGLAETRTKAQALIMAGQVRVDGITVTKMGDRTLTDAAIEVIPGQRYVSRGGEKLEGALADFQVSPEGRVCLDVGSSTGGFTDCLLQRGAIRVYAVDVGTKQLHEKLRNDPRVISIEETHILHLDPMVLKQKPEMAVVDVSFIPLGRILPRVGELMPRCAPVIALVKPQYEVGPKYLKKGVVKSDEARDKAVADAKEFALKNGFECLNITPSRLKGPKGNQEYFLYLKTK